MYDELIAISGMLSERSESIAEMEENFKRRQLSLDEHQRLLEENLRLTFEAEVRAEVERRCRSIQQEVCALSQNRRPQITPWPGSPRLLLSHVIPLDVH